MQSRSPRSQSPGKSPRDRDNHRRSLNIKLQPEADFSKVGDSFVDPVIQQIKAIIPDHGQADNTLSGDKRSAVSMHLDEVLLPEEWLEVDPVYLSTPPSLDTKEFQDILQVCGLLLCVCFNLFLFLCVIILLWLIHISINNTMHCCILKLLSLMNMFLFVYRT